MPIMKFSNEILVLTPSPEKEKMKNILNHFFEIQKNNSSISKEIISGLTTFFSMAYIISVHPAIISRTGMPFNACVTSTVLVCFFSSLMMSFYGKNPLALAPGLGINSFFTFTMVLQMNIPYEKALGATFWAGILFLILSILNIRESIVKAVPSSLKHAIAVGIGLFIAFIGFKQGQWITSSEETLIQKSPFSFENFIFTVGLLITFFLLLKKIKGAFCFSILITTFISWPIGRWIGEKTLTEYNGWISWPDFSLVGQLDFLGSIHLSLLPLVFSLAFVDFFESMGTFMALLNRFKLIDQNKEPRHLKECLITDAFGTLFAGFAGSSSATTYIESATGLQEGGRTGLTALTTAFLFLPFMFLAPLLSIIPSISTAPVLVAVGILMIQPVQNIRWNNLEEAIPAFLTVLLIPLTFSISQGIIWGLISYVFLKIFTGKWIPPTLYLIALTAIFFLVIEYYFFSFST